MMADMRFLTEDRLWAESIIDMAKLMEPGEFLSAADICDAHNALVSRSSLERIGRVMKLMRPRWIREPIVRAGKRILAYQKPEGYRT